MDRTIGRGQYLPIGALLMNVCSGAEIEIGIEALVVVGLRAEILPTQSEIKCPIRRCMPGILGIKGRFMEAIAAREVRGTDRKRERACRRRNIVDAWEFALRIDSSLEIV